MTKKISKLGQIGRSNFKKRCASTLQGGLGGQEEKAACYFQGVF